MSVRQRKWTDRKGKTQSAWVVDIQFQLSDGSTDRKTKTSPVNTKAGATEYERQLRGHLLGGTFQKTDKKTLSDFVETFLEYSRNNNKPSSVYSKEHILKNHLVPAFGSLALATIGPQQIESYKARKKEEGLSAKTVFNHLTILQKLINLELEYRGKTERIRLKKPKVPKPAFDFLTFEETERFLEAAKKVPVWEPLCVLALNTGLRAGELRALRWEDVDLQAKRLVVRQSVWRKEFDTPKSGHSREVPLNAASVWALSAKRSIGLPLVFCHPTGAVYSNSAVERATARVSRLAGLRTIHPHVLRHTFASHLIMRGASLKEVQELLGHATMEMTMRYAHLSPERKAGAVSLLDAQHTRDTKTDAPVKR